MNIEPFLKPQRKAIDAYYEPLADELPLNTRVRLTHPHAHGEEGVIVGYHQPGLGPVATWYYVHTLENVGKHPLADSWCVHRGHFEVLK